MRTELILKRTLLASHSLDSREEPHPHLFKLEFVFTGESIRGRIVDLPLLESAIDALIEPLQGRYLNDLSALPEAARAFPTCETLGATLVEWLQSKTLPSLAPENATLRVVSVMVTLCEPDGTEFGAARTYP